MTNFLRSSEISFKGKIVGRLEETASGGSRYLYHEGCREAIACCLPVSRREHEWQAGLHPFFQHLGAEGWLRERQARAAHLTEEDDFGLLRRYGADCIGAVGVLPDAGQPPRIATSREGINPGRTVSGVQRKLLVVRDAAVNAFRPAELTGPAPYIAKFNSPNLPTLVRNEHLSLRWATAMLGAEEVTEFQLGPVAELDETALIVTRFDRTAGGEKLRAEDFAQILSKPRGHDYAGKYDASYEEVAEAIRAHSARPLIDLARLFRRLVVFTLLANGDAHLKNFTLLERPEGMRLSPVYDVVNVGLYPEVSQRLALALNGDFILLDAVTRSLLVAFAERIGLSKSAIAGIFRDLTAKARQAHRNLPPPEDEGRDPFTARFTEIVRNGCLRLLEE
ncbi:MAG: serine/threonine-protein kinase HipA [Aliidongia sp.]|nr:serine/threonine-protein kinase HipA [Aliidongia sp.]